MKTLFICGKMLTPKHVDEEYDYIHYVDDIIPPEDLEKNGIMIRDLILKIWKDDNEQIKVFVDAHPAFVTIVTDLKFLLKKLHQVEIEYDSPFDVEETEE